MKGDVMKKLAVLVMPIFVFVAFCNAGTDGITEQQWDKLVEQVKAECMHHYTYMNKNEPKRIVSSMDTLYMLGFDKEFKECVKWVEKNYDPARIKDQDVFKFIMTHLGALLSAYQMSGEEVLLEKAVDLADKILPAFDSPTGIPFRRIDVKTGKPHGAKTCPADAGSNLLEFATLSDLTGKDVYYKAAKKAAVAMYDRRSKLDLIGRWINVETGKWVDNLATSGCYSDSYYENLAKGWLCTGDKDLLEMYNTLSKAINNRLTVEDAEGRLWFKEVDMNTGKGGGPMWTSLGDYYMGVLATMGQVELAAKLLETAYFVRDQHGLQPFVVRYAGNGKVHYQMPQFFLAPELIESTWHMWKITGKEYYRRQNVPYFKNIVKYCRKEKSPYKEIVDVRSKKQGGIKWWWISEGWKYFYLTFEENPRIKNFYKEWLFNTEAHPMKIIKKQKEKES